MSGQPDYAIIPTTATLDVQPYTAHVAEDKLQHFRRLLQLSPIAGPSFENTSNGRRYGLTREWLQNAKNVWLNDFDWRQHEDRINSFPNFKAPVNDTHGNSFDIQFLALFSERPDAIPVAFFHGYPGSICEFLDILDLLKSKYTPQTLPYHVIVPSLPGYGYSSGPPLNQDYTVEMAADTLNNLMVGLGFGSGYLAQGGDLGSFISRTLAVKYDACKGVHVNMMVPPSPSEIGPEDPKDDLEKRCMQRAADTFDIGLASSLEQGNRTATVGLVLSSSPLALLSWIGEKLLEWSDEDLPLKKILEDVTLYWMTDSIPRCLYHSRDMFGDPEEKPKLARTSVLLKGPQVRARYISKPVGYSYFANEIVPVPKSWAVLSCNLVSYGHHERGGHFAAMEHPKELLADFEEYVGRAWKEGFSKAAN